ncbi:MAG: hypothetical protein ABIA93_00995 [Candidatus Woesearchaeota archaeon]
MTSDNIFTSVRKALTGNRVQRLLHYIEHNHANIKLPEHDQKRYETVHRKLVILKRETQAYSTVRNICLAILYAGFVTSVVKKNVLIAIVTQTSYAITSAAGTTVLLGVAAFMTYLMNVRVSDAHIRAAKAIAILESKGKKI